MLQPTQTAPSAPKFPSTPTSFNPPKTIAGPMEQATIGRSVVIKGEVSGSEPLYIDGRIEGTIHVADNRVTIGRNGSVQANITAKEVVIMGTVKGNIECTDRLDIRADGSLIGDVSTPRISVEDGAVLKGSVDVRTSGQKQDKKQNESVKQEANEKPKALAASAGA